MIVTHLTDGLGNQLFQYAAGRNLAHLHQTTLKLDAYWYRRYTYRHFGLSVFNIDAPFASLADIAGLCPREAFARIALDPLSPPFKRRAERLVRLMGLKSPYQHRLPIYSDRIPLQIGHVVSQRVYHFDPAVLEVPDNVALTGYWQSEKYFAASEAIIRKELTWKEPPPLAVERYASEIADAESVSFHVRRGDKVAEGQQASTLEFCQKALAFFRSRLSGPRFFVFTDDWKWVSEKLPATSDIVHVRHSEADTEDLRLMSLCRHNLVAPSSFSWWGAWLNSNKEKLVLRPLHFLNLQNPDYQQYDLNDVFPASWQTLEGA